MNSSGRMNTATRRVILAGATGLVGSHLLDGLLADETVAEVHVVGRRLIPVSHANLRDTDHEFLPRDPAAQLLGDLRGESSAGFAR